MTHTNKSNDSQIYDNQSTEPQTGESEKPPDKCMEKGGFSSHLDDIAKRQKEVEEYTPERGWLVGDSTTLRVFRAHVESAPKKNVPPTP